MLVQQGLSADPFDGAVFAFRGRRARLIKLIWHDGIGLCMLTKRLEQGKFIWPSATSSGRIALSAPPELAGASDLAIAMRYAIRHRPGLVVFLDDGRVEMDTNVVERAIRPNTLTKKNALFAGSDGGAKHWALAMTLIQTAKLNGVDPLAWLTDVLERIVSGRTKAHEMHTLLPWTWAAANPGSRAEQLAA